MCNRLVHGSVSACRWDCALWRSFEFRELVHANLKMHCLLIYLFTAYFLIVYSFVFYIFFTDLYKMQTLIIDFFWFSTYFIVCLEVWNFIYLSGHFETNSCYKLVGHSKHSKTTFALNLHKYSANFNRMLDLNLRLDLSPRFSKVSYIF